jgi:hypothetical protein
MSVAMELFAALGVVALAFVLFFLALIAWSCWCGPRLRAWQLRRRQRRVLNEALDRVIAESRAYLTGAKACDQFRSSGKLEIRSGLLSDYCRTCGQPCGAHRARTAG